VWREVPKHSLAFGGKSLLNFVLWGGAEQIKPWSRSDATCPTPGVIICFFIGIMTMKFSLLTALLAALSSTSAFHLSALRAVSDPSSTLLRYKGSDFDDGFSNNNDNGGGGDDFWSALVNTERWISDTLDRSNQAELSRQQQQHQQNQIGQTMHFADEKKDDTNSSSGKDNPYARKEVSYVCEIGSDLATVVGGIFRRVREARELGERHGRDVESRLGSSSSSDANPTTMRSTNVVVIPSCNELATFQTFDALIQSINQARRAARDFVVKKKDDGTKEWV